MILDASVHSLAASSTHAARLSRPIAHRAHLSLFLVLAFFDHSLRSRKTKNLRPCSTLGFKHARALVALVLKALGAAGAHAARTNTLTQARQHVAPRSRRSGNSPPTKGHQPRTSTKRTGLVRPQMPCAP